VNFIRQTYVAMVNPLNQIATSPMGRHLA